jgi:hypothetical protein
MGVDRNRGRRHGACFLPYACGHLSGFTGEVRPGKEHHGDSPTILAPFGGSTMTWTKPEAEVVAVTMEVTAYVATL